MTPSQEAREYPPLPEMLLTRIEAYGWSSADKTSRADRVAKFGQIVADIKEYASSYVDSDRKARQQEALDARRYRWLVEHKPVSLLKMCPSPHEWHYATHDVVDAAIDAAMKGSE